MKLLLDGSKYILETASYSLSVSPDKIGVILDGVQVAGLDPRSALNTLNEDESVNPDTENEIPTLSVENSEDKTIFTFTTKSALWEKKVYTLTCIESRFEYKITVTGKGAVDSVNYFSGNISEAGHGSDYDFAEGYAPVVSLDGSEPYTFSPIKPYERFSYLTVPPMFCYAFRTEELTPYLGLGLVAKPGEHNFTQFNYNTTMHRWGAHFWLWTDNSGHTKIDGEWESPSIFGYSAESNIDAVEKYSSFYYELGYATPKKDEKHPRFWYGPIVCGWLEQLAATYRDEEWGLVDSCRQPLYENMLTLLEKRDLHPKVIIIDDKWQQQYGTCKVNEEKWPDLRGFIDSAREKYDIHTLMWFRMWDSEGLDQDMCVFDESNNRWCVDPTNPKYVAVLKENIHRIISSDEGCYNADGLKIDFAFWQPVGKKANSYSGKYGVELFHELVKLIYQFIKEEKPHAILNASPCHPYFADIFDQARLHDYDYRARNVVEEFTARAQLYNIAVPNIMIDTDGCGYNTRRDTMRYMVQAEKLGVPDIYCLSDTPYMALTEEDWSLISTLWKNYSKKIDESLS